MRILYIATRICWPVRSGAHLRDFHIARHLAANAKLTYIGMDPGQSGADSPAVSYESIEALGDAEVVRMHRESGYSLSKKLRGIVGPLPLVVLNYTSPLMIKEIERILSNDKYDVVQVEGIFLSSYVPRIRQLAPNALLNSDWHNVESGLMQRYVETEKSFAKRVYAQRTVTLLRHLEDRFIRQCDSHTVCSDLERQYLLSRDSGANVEVIPNGVDVEGFSKAAQASSERDSLLFVGSMDYHANIDAVRFFASEVWPSLHQRLPDLKFVVVGSNPVPDIRKLAEQPGITVTGTVDDLIPYYQKAFATIVPLRVGGGTRLKILEAMAAGAPVISTRVGAEGLPVQNGKDILIADSPQEMLEAVALLKQDPKLLDSLVTAARGTVVPFDWRSVGDKLLRLYATQLNSRQAKPAHQ